MHTVREQDLFSDKRKFRLWSSSDIYFI